jgi:two-component system, NtrC family, sensor histidine kinase PilS
MFFPSLHAASNPTHWAIGTEEGLSRQWRGFMAARIVVATVLLLLMVFIHTMGSVPLRRELILCAAYWVLTVVILWFGAPQRHPKRFDPQWLVTVGADVIVFSMLLHWQVSGINFTPLFALPVLLAAVLGPLLLALGTAATVTLVLLADAWWLSLIGTGDATTRYLQAALTGSGLFVVAYLANQLAVRLARQERLVYSSAMAARTQVQVNQMVIDGLSDGVLVIDGNGVVRTANPAARKMLGPRVGYATAQLSEEFAREGSDLDKALPSAPFVLASQAAWQPLADVAWLTLQQLSAQQTEVAIVDTAGAVRRLSVRTQSVSGTSGTDDAQALCVMFLEDLRELEARLRTEKLAAMGRMSAAVAHEIRNPLAAISQANALLAEELQEPAQQKLTSMVQHNAKRLARIVDDVLDISRVTPAESQDAFLPDAEQTIIAICRDWAAQHNCGDQLLLPSAHAQQRSSTVVFEEDHLRRVLVNFLDNALRYASKDAAAIRVLLPTPQIATGKMRLAVWSDSPPLDVGVQRHLFEPFFSSESRSSGLGLYICRELCVRHGASIGYQRTDQPSVSAQTDFAHSVMLPSGNEFFVQLNLASSMLPLQVSAF